ncbi:Capsule biosynthesis GfcC [compost metagenome]
MSRRLLSGLLVLLLGQAVQATETVAVSGSAEKAGSFAFTEGMRLHDVLLPALVDPETYWLGAVWLHQPLRAEQRRLKAGVLFDLRTLERNALLENRPDLAETAARLSDKVRAMPVTGRKVQVLDPIQVELKGALNGRLAAGDRIDFPPRPTVVSIEGAVARDCLLPHAPLRQARDYLQDCPALAVADPDYLFVIQPDGQVTRLGIALWNRDTGAPPAPGARLLVPIQGSTLGDATPDLNRELAELLATQPPAGVTP